MVGAALAAWRSTASGPNHSSVAPAPLPSRRWRWRPALHVLILPRSCAAASLRLRRFGPPQWFGALYLGAFGSALTFYLWAFALERTTPTRVAISGHRQSDRGLACRRSAAGRTAALESRGRDRDGIRRHLDRQRRNRARRPPARLIPRPQEITALTAGGRQLAHAIASPIIRRGDETVVVPNHEATNRGGSIEHLAV